MAIHPDTSSPTPSPPHFVLFPFAAEYSHFFTQKRWHEQRQEEYPPSPCRENHISLPWDKTEHPPACGRGYKGKFHSFFQVESLRNGIPSCTDHCQATATHTPPPPSPRPLPSRIYSSHLIFPVVLSRFIFTLNQALSANGTFIFHAVTFNAFYCMNLAKGKKNPKNKKQPAKVIVRKKNVARSSH